VTAARQGRHRPQLPARQRVRRSHRVRQRGAGDLLARGQDRASGLARPSRRGRHREADAILGQFGLAAKRNELARGLAQGERKLLDVALAYALRPKLLFLDEPTSGVSTRDKGQIMDTIASVVRGEGITAVVIEHDMDVVFKYSDRIVVMHQGAILAQGTPAEIRKNEQVAMILIGSSGTDAFSRKD
jgi:branched-chain amino acid transport system ATP-binding protein